MNEEWKSIDNFETYEISNFGRVRHIDFPCVGKIHYLSQKVNNKGYAWVELRNGKDKKCCLIHRLVANAFIDNLNGYECVNHKDENPLNNKVDNLEWCTASYNVRYSMRRHPDRFPSAPLKYKSKILQFNADGSLVKEWNSLSDLKKAGYHGYAITECCKGNRKTAYQYKWQFA